MMATLAVPADSLRGVGISLSRLVERVAAAKPTAKISSFFARATRDATMKAVFPLNAGSSLDTDGDDDVCIVDVADSPPAKRRPRTHVDFGSDRDVDTDDQIQSTPSRWDPSVLRELPADIIEVPKVRAGRFCYLLGLCSSWRGTRIRPASKPLLPLHQAL
jgi:hypothetical protein